MPKQRLLAGTCHCGAIRIVLPRRPRTLTACNCSICRRYGTIWAYYPAPEVRIEHARGATASYAWGERNIDFVRCATCGCITHWQATRRPRSRRMGVNARLFDPELIGAVRIRLLDGARSWKYLDESPAEPTPCWRRSPPSAPPPRSRRRRSPRASATIPPYPSNRPVASRSRS